MRNVADELKAMARYKDITQRQLAGKIGTTVQNLNNKLKRGDLRESEMREIAEAIGCEIKIDIVDKEERKD